MLKENKEIGKDPKNSFFMVIKEVLSSADDICHGVDLLAKENKIIYNTKENRHRLGEIIIKKRVDISKGVGIAANVPSVIPVVGAIGTTVFMAAIEFISLIRLELEMCMEIAYVHGKDPNNNSLAEALAIIGWCHDKKKLGRLDKMALKNGIKKAVKSYAKKGLLFLTERTAMRIELGAFKKGLPHLIPLLGMPIAAALNYREAKAIGKTACIYYE